MQRKPIRIRRLIYTWLNMAGVSVFFCSLLLAADPPHIDISNGLVNAKLYLPDAEHGYYRGVRFDWSGVISRLDYAGHNYFGVWFPKYEPTLHYAITGPVEEFRSEDGALGYSEAKVGDMFVKIGVGVLQKPDDKPYEFTRNYRIVTTGVWIVRPHADSVEFIQELKGVNGYAYVYSKRVRLVKGKPELILEHTLRNTGKTPIATQVYNHDFYVIDGQPTGPAFSIRFPFKPRAVSDLKGAAVIRGNDFVYLRELLPGNEDSVATYVEGFSGSAKDNDIRVENSKAQAGVRQTGDHPIAKLYLWSVRTTVCPEAYISLNIAPKKKAAWQVKYDFYTLGQNGEENANNKREKGR
jgi:hypothetical protein